ncbi:MAG TPA: phosphoribosyltransferase family protein, partial [Thermoanaerobaculia bacterium]|nr:phosphoribosyltransferase family protein [Thermoanaerobaculia bacterium]
MAQTTLISKTQIEERVAEMGRQISADFAGQEVIACCVLKGAMFFCSDLVRQIDLDVALDFIQVSSYGDQKTSSGVVTILKEPQLDMRDKSVLIVEDIIDSGLSMNEV